MMVALAKGRAAQAEAHLMYLKSLVAREQSDASTVRMLVLEAMIRIYQSKLATRGQVYEIYTIWDLPTGEKISKYAKTFMRLGYQHYEYDYFGTGDWNMMAYDLGDPGDLGKIQMMGQDPVEKADQIYLTFEAYF